jgi:hypothetical protein
MKYNALMSLTPLVRSLIPFPKRRVKMVQAWYYNDDASVDPREAHQYDPPRPVSMEQLAAIGVLHWTFDVSNSDTLNQRVGDLMTQRNYKNKDVVRGLYCIT